MLLSPGGYHLALPPPPPPAGERVDKLVVAGCLAGWAINPQMKRNCGVMGPGDTCHAGDEVGRCRMTGVSIDSIAVDLWEGFRVEEMCVL